MMRRNQFLVIYLLGTPVEEGVLHEGAVHRILLHDPELLYGLVQKFLRLLFWYGVSLWHLPDPLRFPLVLEVPWRGIFIYGKVCMLHLSQCLQYVLVSIYVQFGLRGHNLLVDLCFGFPLGLEGVEGVLEVGVVRGAPSVIHVRDI